MDKPVGLHVNEDERGPGIATYSGGRFYIGTPSPDEVDIDDIAHALSNLCRFTGHTRKFFSVAEHSINVMRVVANLIVGKQEPVPRMQLKDTLTWALLHDAHEAYIGDISRPFKWYLETIAPGMLDSVLGRIDTAIEEHFRLGPEPKALIKQADNICLAAEKRDLMPKTGKWEGMPEPHEWECVGMAPNDARQHFLTEFAFAQGFGYV